MKVSIFTPTHNPKWLLEAYSSIKDQTISDWEWIIIPNNLPENINLPEFNDDRVKIYPLNDNINNIGRLKNYAVSKCTGDILLELDHDDILENTCLEELVNIFSADEEIGFIYANFAEFIDHNGTISRARRFDERNGWKYRSVNFRGLELDECIAFKPTPASFSRVWFSANHPRAWRRTAYDNAGGYSANLKYNDDQELLSRTYLTTTIYHIDKCLYFYRRHEDNATYDAMGNALIQRQCIEIYDQYIEKMCLKWCKLNNLKALNLGGRFGKIPGTLSVDLKDADIIANLDQRWPFEDSSVGCIIANDIIEHLWDKLHVVKEIYRVLVQGGYVLIRVPSSDSRGGIQDPTHKSLYNQNSFLYYTDASLAKWIDTPVRFQSMRLYTTPLNNIGVSWVVSHMCSLKDGFIPPGICSI